MKKIFLISGGVVLLAVILVAGCHHIIRNRSGFRGHERMMTGSNFRHNNDFRSNHFVMNGMHRGMDRMGQMRGQMGEGQSEMMHRGMWQRRMDMMQRGMGQGRMGMRPGSESGMRGGMGRMSQDSLGIGSMGPRNRMGMNHKNIEGFGPVGPGGIILENIPNVTDKQKKEFNDLLKKQQEEMIKMREDMAAKIKSTIESQRSKMLDLFTADQKKAIGFH